MQSIDELAREIMDLTPSQQQALLERVEQLNLRKGLRELAEKYRARLRSKANSTCPQNKFGPNFTEYEKKSPLITIPHDPSKISQ